MGKMGAGELNYSSDIDLICLFDESRFERDDLSRGARGLHPRHPQDGGDAVSDMTAEGYVFRTDLRLRPDPSVTPVCLSMEAAESYYESLGRTWERAAYIKARACAGDHGGGRAVSRHADARSSGASISISRRFRMPMTCGCASASTRGWAGRSCCEGHNMKLGRGGIREIEFFTQTRQLIAGGRDPDLRVRGTVEGLAGAGGEGWVPRRRRRRLTRITAPTARSSTACRWSTTPRPMTCRQRRRGI